MTGKDYILYKQRWLILVGVVTCAFIRGCFPGVFAICNDMMTVYFRITPLQADMLSTADSALAVIVCIGTSIVGKKVGVRLLSLTVAVSFAIGSTAVGIAITDRKLYGLMLAGRLVCGISSALLYLLPPIFANAWFPSNQVAVTAAIPITVMCVGGVVVPMVFSIVLPKANTNATFENATSNSSLEIQQFDRLREVFIINMAIFVALSVMSIGLFWIYAKNHPPTPPSGAQAQLLKTERERNHKSDLRQNFRTLLEILRLAAFWNLALVTIINSALLPFTLYLQPSLLKATFEDASNAVAGYCLMFGTITAACGSIAAGKILDKWHDLKKFCMLAFALSGGSCVAVYFGQVHQIIWMFFVFQGIVSFLRLSIYVCSVELVLEVTYPRDRTVAACLFFACYNLSAFLSTALERWVMVRFGEQYVAWVAAISQAATAFILFLLKPKYKRTLANKRKIENVESSTLELKSRSHETSYE